MAVTTETGGQDGPTPAALARRVHALQRLQERLHAVQVDVYGAGVHSAWCRLVDAEAEVLGEIESVRDEARLLLTRQASDDPDDSNGARRWLTGETPRTKTSRNPSTE